MGVCGGVCIWVCVGVSVASNEIGGGTRLLAYMHMSVWSVVPQ